MVRFLHVRSAPKADMCSATGDVGYGPNSGHAALFDDFVCSSKQWQRHSYAECLCSFEIDDEFKFGRLPNRQISGLFALAEKLGLVGNVHADMLHIGAVEGTRFNGKESALAWW